MGGDFTAAREWRAAYERVLDLARAAGDSGLQVSVPATPDWRARDLLAHMIGVGVDAVAREVPDERTDGWTAGHVRARSEATTQQLLAEWADAASGIEALIAEWDLSPFADIIIHEQDLRGALQQPGARDTAGFARIREMMTGRFADAVAEVGDAGPLRLQAVDDSWSWNSGEGAAAAVVEAPAFDLGRAITSRRSAGQLRGWTTRGSVDVYLFAFAQLGDLPQQALAE